MMITIVDIYVLEQVCVGHTLLSVVEAQLHDSREQSFLDDLHTYIPLSVQVLPLLDSWRCA